MNGKKWSIATILSTFIFLAVIAVFNITVDPFLHFHKPLKSLEYPLNDERYTNDGITRHYSYDAVITGTSMALNFRASQMDALWGTQAIKVAYSGATIHELTENLKRTFDYNDGGIKYVVMSLDVTQLNRDKDDMGYIDYPEYMYDGNYFNDVYYVLNKDVIPKSLAVINFTRAGNKMYSLDEYGNFDRYMEHGREAVLRNWSRQEISEREWELSDDDRERILENVTENVYNIAIMNPDTEFYFFFPPYSICYWDSMVRTKQMGVDIEARLITCEILTKAPNIHLFEFSDEVEIIENLDNYSDALHYAEWVNEYMLQCMYEGKHELTADNYREFYHDLANFFEVYDYSVIFG